MDFNLDSRTQGPHGPAFPGYVTLFSTGCLREHCVIDRHAMRKYIAINDIHGCEKEETSVICVCSKLFEIRLATLGCTYFTVLADMTDVLYKAITLVSEEGPDTYSSISQSTWYHNQPYA